MILIALNHESRERMLMSLAWERKAGQTVSHYQIVEKLGEGGMGAVYKATDLRLDRFVALKFLAPHLMGSPDAQMRFLQEAKAISTLNHPNIATIYEVDSADGVPFLAL